MSQAAPAASSSSFLARHLTNQKNRDTAASKLMQIMSPMFVQIHKLKQKGDNTLYADLAFGNPQEQPITGFVQALRTEAARGMEPDCDPALFQYQREFDKEKQAILESLQRRRGETYDKLTADHIWVTNGAFGGLQMSFKTFANAGQVFVTVIPEYFGYDFLIQALECTTHGILLSPDDDFDLNVPKIQDTLLHHPDADKMRILILTNPNNPSGQLYTTEKLQELAAALRLVNHHRAAKDLPPIILISDEAYHRIIFPSTNRPFVSPASFYEYTISVYSYAKTCMCPAERLGWLTLSPLWPVEHLAETRDALRAVQIASGWAFPSYTNARCIPALERFVDDPTIQGQQQQQDGVIVDLHELQRRRDLLVQAFRNNPSTYTQVVTPASGFYLLARVPEAFKDNDVTFCRYLAERYRVFVMPGCILGLPGWMRLSVTASAPMVDFTCEQLQAFAQEYQGKQAQPNPKEVMQAWVTELQQKHGVAMPT